MRLLLAVLAAAALAMFAPTPAAAQDATCGYTKPSCVNDVQGAARCVRNPDTTYTCAVVFCTQPTAPSAVCETKCLTATVTVAGSTPIATIAANLCSGWKTTYNFPP